MTGIDSWRAAVAIEPMTCLPGSFRSGVELIELAPGAWRIMARDLAARFSCRIEGA